MSRPESQQGQHRLEASEAPAQSAPFKDQLHDVKNQFKDVLSQLLRSQFEQIRSNLVDAVRDLADQFERLEPVELLEEDGLALYEAGPEEETPDVDPVSSAAEPAPIAELGLCPVPVAPSTPNSNPAAHQIESPPVEQGELEDARETATTSGPAEQASDPQLSGQTSTGEATARAPLAQGESGVLPDVFGGQTPRHADRVEGPQTLRLRKRRSTCLVVESSKTVLGSPELAADAAQADEPRGHHEAASPLAGKMYSEALRCQSAQEYSAALARYADVIRLDPLFVPAYCERGQLQRNLGAQAKALADFDQACALDPGHAEAFLRRGNVLTDLGHLEAAITDYSRAIKLDPQQPVYYLNRGLAQAKRSAYAEVIADADQALALDENLTDAYFIRGFALHRRSRHDEALADFQRLLDLNPNNALAWNERGLVHLSQGQYDDAIRDYVQALRINPKLLLARYNRGIAFRLKGNYLMAIADFSELLRRKPKNCQAHLNRGICYFAMGDFDRALPDFACAHELLPDDKEIAGRLKQVRAALEEQHRARSKSRGRNRRSTERSTASPPPPPLVPIEMETGDMELAPPPAQPRGGKSWHALRGAIPYRAVAVVTLMAALIYPIYALTAKPAPRWQRYSVAELCQMAHNMAQGTEIDVCGHIRSLGSDKQAPSVVLGNAEGAEQVACQMDPWALSNKRLLPHIKPGDFVILKGKFLVSSNGAPTLSAAHFADKAVGSEE